MGLGIDFNVVGIVLCFILYLFIHEFGLIGLALTNWLRLQTYPTSNL